MLKVLPIVIYCILNLDSSVDSANYKILAKSLKCFNFNPDYMTVETCKIRAKRGTSGLLNLSLKLSKPLDDLWDHVQMFTQTSTLRFQPWIINIELNACDAVNFLKNLKGAPTLIRAFLKFFDVFMPDLEKGCPFKGFFNLTDWDFDKEAQKLLPPIIPEGVFLIHHRIHTASNITIGETKFVVDIRPVGVAELIKLG